MAQILDDMHSKYVPTVTLDGVTEVLDHVIFDGDQLTEERARNAQWANSLAGTQTDRIEGITPAFADWHLKKNFLTVCICLIVYTEIAMMMIECKWMHEKHGIDIEKQIYQILNTIIFFMHPLALLLYTSPRCAPTHVYTHKFPK